MDWSVIGAIASVLALLGIPLAVWIYRRQLADQRAQLRESRVEELEAAFAQIGAVLGREYDSFDSAESARVGLAFAFSDSGRADPPSIDLSSWRQKNEDTSAAAQSRGLAKALGPSLYQKLQRDIDQVAGAIASLDALFKTEGEKLAARSEADIAADKALGRNYAFEEETVWRLKDIEGGYFLYWFRRFGDADRAKETEQVVKGYDELQEQLRDWLSAHDRDATVRDLVRRQLLAELEVLSLMPPIERPGILASIDHWGKAHQALLAAVMTGEGPRVLKSEEYSDLVAALKQISERITEERSRVQRYRARELTLEDANVGLAWSLSSSAFLLERWIHRIGSVRDKDRLLTIKKQLARQVDLTQCAADARKRWRWAFFLWRWREWLLKRFRGV